jgi:hypothetical protein
MTVTSLLIFSNNADLNCISAHEAIKAIPGTSFISNLARFRKITFQFSRSSEHDIMSAIQILTTQSFDILNPNKESYHTDHIPSIKPAYSHVVEVAPKSNKDDTSLLKRIRIKYSSIGLEDIRQSVVWHFKCTRPLSPTDISFLDQNVIITSTRQSGLLVNPLFETMSHYQITHMPVISKTRLT